MNSDNPFLKKRENPFKKKLSDDPSEVPDVVEVEEVKTEEVKKVVETAPQEVKIVKKEPVQVLKKAAPVLVSTKKAPVVVDERVKYTATMEKDLRIRVKIAAFKQGIDFSTYIEEACLKKLEEGDE